MRAWQALYRRDFKKASALFSQAVAMGADAHSQLILDSYVPARIGWLLRQALSEALGGSPAKASVIYAQVQEMASAGLAAESGSRNVEAAWHAALGMANAGLGQKEQAVAEGKAATALVPFAVDHWEGQDWEAFLAQIYAMNGDAEHAVSLIERPTEATASAVTPAMLRVDPIWDPVRKDARFQALLAKQPAGQKKAPSR
jgi:serine/threonine-protein kinase